MKSAYLMRNAADAAGAWTMPDRYALGIRPSDITPERVWLRRRELLAGAATLGLAGSLSEPAASAALRIR